ncbi:MAG: hypothetical protein D6785_11290 [Planctomycetota bacterium]|nr:MAG: hypothetical protein D6785_11290 [Planctomycetota bacterium]
MSIESHTFLEDIDFFLFSLTIFKKETSFSTKEKSMKTVGYLEGTDPLFLTRLTLDGIFTFPLSNGLDNHGKYLGLINQQDNIDVIVGFLHKLMICHSSEQCNKDLFYPCELHRIPIVAVVPKGREVEGKKLLESAFSGKFLCVSPDHLWQTVVDLLNGK